MQLDHGTPEFIESFSNIGEKTWESLNIPRHSRVLQFHARCSSVQLQGAQGQEQEGPDGMKGMEGAPKLIKDDYTLFFWVWNLSSSKGFLVGKCQAHPAGPCQCMLLDTGMSGLKMGYTPKSLNLLIIYIDLWSFDQLTVPFLYIFMASPHLSHPSSCNYLLSRSTPTSSLRCQWCSAGRMDTASYRHTWKNRGHLRCCETLADPKVGTKSSS